MNILVIDETTGFDWTRLIGLLITQPHTVEVIRMNEYSHDPRESNLGDIFGPIQSPEEAQQEALESLIGKIPKKVKATHYGTKAQLEEMRRRKQQSIKDRRRQRR